MPRLRNTRTGSVVNVSDVTAARLDAGYKPADSKSEAAEKKPAARRKASSTTEK